MKNDDDKLKEQQALAPVSVLGCPMCGSQADIFLEFPPLPNGKTDRLYFVQCILRECGIRTRSWYPQSAAIASWNRRQPNERTELPPPDTTVASKKNVQ